MLKFTLGPAQKLSKFDAGGSEPEEDAFYVGFRAGGAALRMSIFFTKVLAFFQKARPWQHRKC